MHDKGNENQKAKPEMLPLAYRNKFIFQIQYSRLSFILRCSQIIPLYESAVKDYNILIHFIEEKYSRGCNLGVIYIVSVEEAAGKTTICAGLGKYLMTEGKKVGYLKPLASGKDDTDSDATFMRRVLGMSDDMNASDIIKGRDVVLVEGTLGPNAGDSISQSTYSAAKEMKAKAVAVEVYSGQASDFADSYKGFGDNLLGVIINKVPQSQLKSAGDKARADFGAVGINVLGVIPENRALLAMTVGELADNIKGKILNSTEKSAELVENYMLGAMVVDSGLDYFWRKNNKAAIIRRDRPDMQLAALETPTRCLVLSGNGEAPAYNVLQKAEIRDIPIISTETVTDDIVGIIEDALSKTKLEQESKLPILAEIVKQNLDVKALV
jgi:BioD-like phosphotransacetylase family protein